MLKSELLKQDMAAALSLGCRQGTKLVWNSGCSQKSKFSCAYAGMVSVLFPVWWVFPPGDCTVVRVRDV